MPINFRRTLAIGRKEFLHILYDSRTLLIVLLMPVVQLVLFGYALNLEIQRIDMAVIDYAHSIESRRLAEQFRGSPSFRPFYYDGSLSGIDQLFKRRTARVVMIIQHDFDQALSRSAETSVQFLIDAADPNAATMIRNYCNQVLRQYNERREYQLPAPLDVRPAILFNPDLKSRYFFVPGVMAMILIMVSALLTSVSIAREKESGTLEQVLVSPVRPIEIIVGKVLPYVLLALLDACLILVAGLLIFNIPMRGSVLLLFSLMLLYIFTGLSLGLMISTRVRTQQVALMFAQIATVLPTIMLSGLVFPIASMPKLLQYVTYLIPARYFLQIVRGIMLKGSTLDQLLPPTLFLTGMSFVLLVISIRNFSTTLEE